MKPTKRQRDVARIKSLILLQTMNSRANGGDSEQNHAAAEQILCAMLLAHGETEIVKEFNAARLRCPFWYA